MYQYEEKKRTQVNKTGIPDRVKEKFEDRSGYSFDDVKKYVTEAREVIDSYLTADQYTLIENYADLIELESEYTSTGSSGGSSEEVSIPMC